MDIQRINELCCENKLTRSAQMKFKIASILELVIPLSVLVALSLSACGGGGGAYGTTRAYDGVWNVQYAITPAAGGASPVVCAGPVNTPLTLTNGFGHTEPLTACEYGYLNATGWANYPTSVDVGVTYGNLASQSAVISVDVTGGGLLVGTCDTPNSCRAGTFYMYR